MKVAATSIVLLLILTSTATAGFIPATIKAELTDANSGHGPPPWAGPPSFVFDLIPPDANRGLMKLDELFGGSGALAYVISGTTDTDPIMTVQKTVENDSGFTWTGYEIALPDDGDIKFVGTPTSDKMTLTTFEDYLLVFDEPVAVEVGQTVTYTFDVLIPSVGPFSFTLTQTPIPEPATLLVMTAAGLPVLLRRRRRRS